MSSLFARRDVVVVASVSCIYGIGSKEDYEAMVIPLKVGQEISREILLYRLIDLQYSRNDIDFSRGATSSWWRASPASTASAARRITRRW